MCRLDQLLIIDRLNKKWTAQTARLKEAGTFRALLVACSSKSLKAHFSAVSVCLNPTQESVLLQTELT